MLSLRAVLIEVEDRAARIRIKVQRIAIGGGKMRETHHGGPKHNKHHGHHNEPFGAMEAAATARAAGYELIGRHPGAIRVRPGEDYDELTMIVRL